MCEKDVWTCRDIAANASNWNLSSDVNLLKHLEAFSDRLLESSRKTSDKLDTLLTDLDGVALTLDLARNEFASLSNAQFIESRVYEEDEMADEPKRECIENNEENTEDDLKVAASRGLAVIEKYFDRVDVPESDSEDDDLPNFVLRPKDPYVHRPLPYVIGTKEWYESTSAGVLDSSSDSEVERLSEKYSDDSESEEKIGENKMNNNLGSVTESEISEGELSNKIEKPIANSTFNNVNKESVSQDNSVTFAEQLAQKLGNVINANEVEATVNTRPIQTRQQSDYGRLFSNEPPPIDDNDVFNNENSQGIFSGGDGLFDDLENDVSFWGEESKPDVQNNKKPKENQVENLFEESDDDLFSSKAKDPPVKKKIPNLFDDDSDDMFAATPETKPKQQTSSLFDTEDVFNNNDNSGGEIDRVQPKVGGKTPNLFSDSDSDSDGLFSSNLLSKPKHPTVKKSRETEGFSLFDDDKDDLFASKEDEVRRESPHVVDETDPEIEIEEKEETTYQNESPEKETELVLKPTISETKQAALYEPPDVFEDVPPTSDIFEDVPPTGDIFEDASPTGDILENVPPIGDIFEDISPTSDIFGDIPPKETPPVDFPSAGSSPSESDLWNDNEPPVERFSSGAPPSIFDDEPPSLPFNEPFSAGDNLFASERETEKSEKVPPGKKAQKDVTFWENTPVLDQESATDGNVSSSQPDEKTSPGKLKHNLNINVQALLPGGVPIRKGLSKPQRPASLAEFSNFEDYQPNPIGIPRVPLKRDKTPIESTGEDVEVLQSITKTRARIPNRRPSTKRGREALRKSCIDFTVPSAADISEEKTDGKSFIKSDNFATPEYNKPDLFENDNDDDLFSEKKLPPRSRILKKNLFDDDDDDIDFFQSLSQPKRTISTDTPKTDNLNKPMVTTVRKPAMATIKKLENVRVTEDDPLNAFDR